MWNKVKEIRTATITYLGENAVTELERILNEYKTKGIKKIGIITGRSSYLKSGAWHRIRPIIETLKFEYLHFNRVSSNPTTEILNEAVNFFKSFGPQLLIAIGGGSPIDATKAVASLLVSDSFDVEGLFLHKWHPAKALPIVAVNLTHGTGSEVDRFAVATIQSIPYKGGIGYRCLYPEYSIDDPSLMKSLSSKQSRYTTLDAMNHLIEAATSTKASAYTIMLAREGIERIVKWLPVVLKEPENTEARYWLLYASLLGGLAIDSAVVHLTHPMEHLLSAINPSLPHGLGLALLLPSVIEAIYPATEDVLLEILKPIVKKTSRCNAVYLRDLLWDWLGFVGFTEDFQQYGFTHQMLPQLVDELLKLYSKGSLMLSPVQPAPEVIAKIYSDSINHTLKK